MLKDRKVQDTELSDKLHVNVFRRVKLPQPKNQKLLLLQKYVSSRLILCNYPAVFSKVNFENFF